MKFTPSRQRAIRSDLANLQLTGCAGSGKTVVVAEPVVQLVRSAGGCLTPLNIITFTFTGKATAELKETGCADRPPAIDLGALRGTLGMLRRPALCDQPRWHPKPRGTRNGDGSGTDVRHDRALARGARSR
jgi:hypothetical protein